MLNFKIYWRPHRTCIVGRLVLKVHPFKILAMYYMFVFLNPLNSINRTLKWQKTFDEAIERNYVFCVRV